MDTIPITGARTRLAGEMPGFSALLPKQHQALSHLWMDFPVLRGGFCCVSYLGGREGALIGEELVLKCHRKIYIVAQPLQVLIVLWALLEKIIPSSSVLFFSSSPAFFSLFYSPNSWWILESWEVLGRVSYSQVCCARPAESWFRRSGGL